MSPMDGQRQLLEACAFAARAHRGQLRKDRETPYVSHVFRSCLVVRHVFGVDDAQVLMAAVLHDTVEDTTTDFDDIEERFGAEVASWVAALSKDKRLPEPEREERYEEQLRTAPWQVKVCKLADIFDNLVDATHTDARRQIKTYKNARRYLDAVGQGLPERLGRAWETVSGLLRTLEAQQAGQAGGA